MKIRMKTLAAGPKGVLLEGQIYDLPDKDAQALVAGNYAEVVRAQAANTPAEPKAEVTEESIETADAPAEPVEEAVTARPRARSRTTKEE